MELSQEAIEWLIKAGRFMQSKQSQSKPFSCSIKKNAGETYPEAVLRELHWMTVEAQNELFDIVDWAVQYDAAA